MGWTVYYQVVRARRFDERELAAVAALEREVNARPWDAESFGLAVATRDTEEQVIARGLTKLAMDLDESEDAERICEALTRLQRLVPDAEVRATDDFGMMRWHDGDGFVLGGRGAKRPLVEPEGDGDWKGLAELAPPPGPKLPKKVAAALAAHAAGALDDASSRDPQVIKQAFELAAGRDGPRDEAKALLAACDPDVVARAGLEAYPRIQHGMAARGALRDALARVGDATALAGPFLAMWARPKGVYYYGDLSLPDAFAAAVAAVPEVTARLVDDVRAGEAEPRPDDIVSRRAERAIALLAMAAHPAGVACLLRLVQRWRRPDADIPHHVLHYVVLPAIKQLALHPVAAAAPGLTLALDGSSLHWGAHREVLRGLAAVRGDLARPLIAAALASGDDAGRALDAAAILRDPALLGAVEPYLGHPLTSVRRAAEAAVEAITGTRPAAREVAAPADDPEPLILHRDREVRARALKALAAQVDPATFESLVVAERIDALIQGARGSVYTVPIDWRPWKDRLPADVVAGRAAERYRWARAEAELALGPQRRLDAVAAWWDDPAGAVAEMGPFRLSLDPALRAQLVRDEAEALAVLEAAVG